MAKLALGTAQFGFDYGINNLRGKVPPKEVEAILDQARVAGIDMLDTAAAYGESEAIIGDYLKRSKSTFNVISKLPKCLASEIDEFILKSLELLGLKQIYGCLVHDFASFMTDCSIWKSLQGFQAAGKIKKIGFSLYYPKELDYLLEKGIRFDLVQVPYNLFDQRFEGYFNDLQKRDVEVHIRSVFLQGLVFKKLEDLAPEFSSFENKLRRLHQLSAEHSLSVVNLCLNFCMTNKNIDRAVIGVDSLDNFIEIIKAAKETEKVKLLYRELEELKEDNENLLIPSNWERLHIGANKT